MTTMMEEAVLAPVPVFEFARMEAFMGRLMSDMSGAVVSLMCALGDRLGLFKDLAAQGPATSEELAARTGTHERYVREWLSALASAGYLEYDPESTRFTLPIEHAPALAGEGGMMFMGGEFQQLPALARRVGDVADAFRSGAGVSQDAYDEDLWEGMERISAGWFENLLVQEWIAAVPALRERLAAGARVADVGSGSGRALLKLAEAFPASRFVGYDTFPRAVERATANAAAAGVSDRVRFEERDVHDGLPEGHDLITAFDVIHDAADPLRALTAIRRALAPDGSLLLLEINSSHRLEENAGPIGAILYGTSVMFCTPTSLAEGGPGLGTMGLPEVRVRELCARAGFSQVRRLPVDNPFNVLYHVTP
jgi:SAM-dependent methyltransferase